MKPKPVEVLLKEKKIFEIVNPRLVQGRPDMTIENAIKLMQEMKSGYVVISQDNKVAGLLTDQDIIHKILDRGVDGKRPVSDFMIKAPPVLNMQDTVGQAIDVMGTQNLYYIPLVDEKQNLVNVISVRTLTRFLAEFYPTEIYNLPPKPNQIMMTQEGG